MPHYVLDARTATPHFPGIGRYVTSLVPALTEALQEDETLSLLASHDDIAQFASSGRVQVQLVRDSPFSLHQQISIPKLLKQLKADLYHSAYLLMPYHPGAPTVLTLYDTIPLLFPQQSTWRAKTLFTLLLRVALAAANGVAYISKNTEKDVEHQFSVSKKKTMVTPLAPAPQFRPISLEVIAQLRSKLHLPERYLLYVGSNKPHKNLIMLVEAYTVLKKRSPDTPPLVIAGYWDARYPQAKQLAEQSSGLDGHSVIWLGPQAEQDLPALYSGAALFIFPSLYEGFGLPVLEAMSCGTPALCADVPALREVAGDATMYFDPHDANALTSLLGRVLPDDQQLHQLREYGLARAQQYSWKRTAQQTLELYRQVLAQHE